MFPLSSMLTYPLYFHHIKSFPHYNKKVWKKNHNFCSYDTLCYAFLFFFFFCIARQKKLGFQPIKPWIRSECRSGMFPLLFLFSVAYSTFSLPLFSPPSPSVSPGLNFKRKANNHPEKMIRKKSFISVKIKTVKVKILLWISASGTDELFQHPIRGKTFFLFF